MPETLENNDPSARNPFPGLRPFEPEESEFFFGREDDIYELLERLRRVRFLAVVGESGCGKSSVIRAGLIASLQDGFMVENGSAWRIAMMRPWQSPISQLATTLAGPKALNASEPKAIEELLRRGALGIIEAIRKYPVADAKLLILVDQFDELITFMKSEGAVDEARAFVKLLLEAAEQREYPIYIALTLRSELLGGTVALHGLPEAINRGLHLLPQMSREQLRDVIKGPIELSGARIDERVVDRMLNDLGDHYDQLPVLQHALMRMWSAWASEGDKSISLAHYEKIGPLENSLSKHAQSVFDEFLDKEQQTLAEAVFRSITETVGGQIVRNPLTFQKILESTKQTDEDKVRKVINEFREDGRSFLLPRILQPLTTETVVDISHESLFRQWKSLKRWAEDEALKKELYRQISESALLWEKKDFNDSFLFRGARLIEADNWAKDNGDKLNKLEIRFLEASRNLHRAEIHRKTEEELSKKVVEEGIRHGKAVLTGAARVYIDYSRKDLPFVKRLREALNSKGIETVLDLEILPGTDWPKQLKNWVDETEAFIFVISPDSIKSVIARKELEYALQLNKRVIPVVYRKVDPEFVPASLRVLQWIFLTDEDEFDSATATLGKVINTDLYWARTHARLSVRAADWESNAQNSGLLLRGTELKEAEGWLAQAEANKEPTPTMLQIQYITASRKASYRRQRLGMASLSMALILAIVISTFALWQYAKARQSELEAREALNEVTLARQASGTAFSPDGNLLFTVSKDGRGRLTDISGKELLEIQAGTINSSAFSADGKFIAYAGSAGKVSLVELQTFKFHLLSNEAGNVMKLAFSPDSQLLAAATNNGNTKIWNVGSGAQVLSLVSGERDVLLNAAFSPDGKTLMTTSNDGSIRLWDVTTGKRLEVIGER